MYHTAGNDKVREAVDTPSDLTAQHVQQTQLHDLSQHHRLSCIGQSRVGHPNIPKHSCNARCTLSAATNCSTQCPNPKATHILPHHLRWGLDSNRTSHALQGKDKGNKTRSTAKHVPRVQQVAAQAMAQLPSTVKSINTGARAGCHICRH